MEPSEGLLRKKNRNDSQRNSEVTNPCLKEDHATLECLMNNSRDKNKCQKYFENCRACKKFWKQVKSDRQSQGLKEDYPPLEEREQVKNEYFKKKR